MTHPTDFMQDRFHVGPINPRVVPNPLTGGWAVQGDDPFADPNAPAPPEPTPPPLVGAAMPATPLLHDNVRDMVEAGDMSAAGASAAKPAAAPPKADAGKAGDKPKTW